MPYGLFSQFLAMSVFSYYGRAKCIIAHREVVYLFTRMSVDNIKGGIDASKHIEAWSRRHDTGATATDFDTSHR